jgi:broad specificity phosphatase PhoE
MNAPARIVLVRHGPSAFKVGGVFDRAGVEGWRSGYDSAGIHPDARPPATLVQMAREATHLIASDMPRAIASAEALGAPHAIQVSELLREAPLAIPKWPTRLPLAVWGTLMHLTWSYRIARGVDETEPDRMRAEAASEWLASLVADGSMAIVVTHGVFRRLLGKHLVLMGWTSAPRNGGYRHWSSWSFSASRR